MLGIVAVSHGSLSKGLKNAAEVIFGEDQEISTVSLQQADDVDKLGEDIHSEILKVNTGDGVVVFVDLLGASPYNQATLAVSRLDDEIQKSVYVISGVNLPLLLEALNQRILGSKIEDAVEAILAQGNDSVHVWNIDQIASDNEDDDF